MTYKVLYRKYRPNNFSEVVGQDIIVEILKKSIINNKTAHAYIFTGVRGTGKTSLAKIFAKTINCLNQIDGEPCEKCINCLNIDDSPDIIEIDAASNNGIEHIREIISNSRLVPSSMNYKIYIIDEVHMLSIQAYNALLKTLEEPVDHVKFILATTEIQKVPLTILSRCQRFDFSRISEQDTINFLKTIVEKEKIKSDDETLQEIAILSDGSLRDALSILDKLSNNSKAISIKDLENSYGAISSKNVDKIVGYIENKDVKGFIELYNKIKTNGFDIGILINKLINNYKEKIYSSINKNNSIIIYYKNIVTALLDCQKSLKTSTNSDLLFEINMISLILEAEKEEKPKKEEKALEQLEKTKLIEPNLESKTDIFVPETNEDKVNNKKEFKKIRINNCFVNANKKIKIEKEKQWLLFLKSIEESNLTLFSMVENSQLEVASDKYMIISIKNKNIVKLIDEELEEFEREFSNYIKTKVKLCFLAENEWNIEKEKYIKNKNSKKEYEMMDEPTTNNKIDKLSNSAIDLFGEDIVDIR